MPPRSMVIGSNCTVEIHAVWAGGRHGYRYNVTLAGESIVHQSADPELDLARALLARGVKGLVTVLDETGKSRTRVNIEKAAKLRMTEESRGGLRFRKYSETPDNSPYTGESPGSIVRAPATATSFPQKKIQEAA